MLTCVRPSDPRRSPIAPRTRLPLALLLATAALAAGCGSDAASETTATTSSTSPTAPAATVDPVAEDLAGRYAHYDVVAYESTDMKTLIISYGFTDLTVEDGVPTATESFCHSEHRSDQPISVQMSDAATSAITPIPTAVTLTTDGGVVHLSRPETPTGIGVRLDDPANDPLPTDPDDPRIADDDHDGNPGVTAHITVTEDLQGDIYIARREIFAYEVDQQDDGSLTGTVSDHSEQLIIGASDPIFAVPQGEWVQVPDLSKSPIILIPVDDDWDCERLMAERDDLFPPTPEVDW